MPKRRRSESAEQSDEERQRRQRQRELRLAAISARARGEAFINPTKSKRKPLEARRHAKRVAERKATNAAQRRAAQKEVKRQRALAPDIVIVPIFWKGEAKQMARVLSACADVEAALSASGKRILLDAGHKFTPGQKFAHWEHKGVQLRVEVGPREAERGCCTVARTFAPGTPAHRMQRVSISADTLPAELERVMQQAPPDGDEANREVEASAEQAPLAEEPVADAMAAVASERRGGDDLEDDYAIETADVEQPPASNDRAQARQAKQAKRAKSAGARPRDAGTRSAAVVTF